MVIEKKHIEQVFKQRNWWDLIINLKISSIITQYLANKTTITPNQVTLLSFIVAIFAGVAFWKEYYILGAFLYQFSYILDIVDGALARVTHQTSKFGAFFDVFTDWIKAPILYVVLFLKFNQVYLLIVLLLLLFFNCLVNKYNDMLYYQGSKSITKDLENAHEKNLLKRYLLFMKEKHIQPFPSTIEVEALLLFFYPIFQHVIFVYMAFAILIFQFVLKFYAIIKKIQ
ncbi:MULTISPECIES: CDP-alcohol phosphatidyltransferase family protein [unclassified Nitratiruptor]|uniref:CDP-alcohol phosphatidyltransferase family protein n=1 Tax=unclassified Nitratiruptor TaxID=2624044 RepID=UPI0019153145|nr:MULTISPECIES: CDP-alcohol phosphatidyltransferase family protein [unclassified Nitratiruptor]BCD60570.1 CDP-alcohol phosphatidyltransferase [Nitratiruptor sp. YY08-10]BCD64501.1 CDP-alcohol phosphatidyltransferase [Nitratiruptor sp. YY08-14]